MKKTSDTPAVVHPESTVRCFMEANPLSGFSKSHELDCPMLAGPKDARRLCHEPVDVHAKLGHWCGNVCEPCGKRMESRGALISAITITTIIDMPTKKEIPEDAIRQKPSRKRKTNRGRAVSHVRPSRAGVVVH